MATELSRAIAHAVNYHSLDARLKMPDWQVADMLEPQVQAWLDGRTDVQAHEKGLNNG